MVAKQVRLSDKNHKDLVWLANREDRSICNCVNWIIATHIKKEKKRGTK